jgi:hypothetical protein
MRTHGCTMAGESGRLNRISRTSVEFLGTTLDDYEKIPASEGPEANAWLSIATSCGRALGCK